MERTETQILREPWDVDRRLSELGLSRRKLLEVVAVAMTERANATPYHPINAPGTFAYQHAVFALRDKFVPSGFEVDREGGVESIRHDGLQLKVAFANVDIACNFIHMPQPRSEKGSGAERAAIGNLFGDLPQYAPQQRGGYSLYYLMMDEDGNAELTRAVVQNKTFVAAIERLFLGKPDDELLGLDDQDDDAIDNFDPQVARK